MADRLEITTDDITALIAEGLTLYATDPTRSLELATEARTRAESRGDAERVARADLLASYALEHLSRSHESIEKAETARDFLSAAGDRLSEANACNAIGIAGRSLSRYGEALLSFRRALALFHELEDAGRAAATRNNIGSVYEMIGDYDRALEEYLAALEHYRETSHRLYEGVVAGNVGNIYYAMDDLEKAEEWHGRALEISRDVGDRLGEATWLLNLSSIHRHRGETDAALDLVRPALDIVREIGHRRMEGAILAKIGILEDEKGDGGSATAAWEEATEILREVGAEREYGDVLIRRGEAAARGGERERGRELLEEGIGVFTRIGERKAEHEGYRFLAELYEEEGDFRRALEVCRRMQDLYIEIKGEERERSIAAMQARFDVAQKELERKHFEERAAEQERIAAERSKELNAAAMLLIKKNSLLQGLREELEEIRAGGDLNRLAKASGTIEQSLRSDDDWKRFEETYRLVHHDFISRLSARFPDLSPTELKVAALLHIDLSNKEIADLLCISLRTVESHRYNIRKKLNLPGSANLAVQIGGCVGE